MNTETNATLFAKLAAVMGRVRTIAKNGRNEYDLYDYMTADDIATRIGSLLAEQKVAFLPSLVSVETTEFTTAKGAVNLRTVITMQMVFADGDSGATWTSVWQGEAADRGDKSVSKAATSAVKYFLIKTFLLAGGEDDADAESHEVAGKRTQGAQRPQGATQAAANAETELLNSWTTPEDAYAWAVSIGACDNPHHARESFAKVVTEMGGKFNAKNARAVYSAYIRRQQAKIQAAAAVA